MKKSVFIGVSNLKRTLLFLSAVLVVMTFSGVAHTGDVYTKLNVPDSCNTYAYGIDGNNIVGTYRKVGVSNDYYVFLYDITTSTYTILPDSPVSYYPGVVDIDGNNIVGCYKDDDHHGFLYNIDSKTYTTLDVPGSDYTHAYGIDGNNIVGYYWDEDDDTYHVFIYNIDSKKYTTLYVADALWRPGVVRIDGNNIVGYHTDNTGSHSFIYNIDSKIYTTLHVPYANSATYAYGIDGNNIVGTWYNGPPHGFLYNITSETYTTLDVPEAHDYTEVWGIDGNNIVGWYWNEVRDYGFVTSEPGITPINDDPVLNSIGNKTGNEGQLLDFTVIATDPDPGDTLNFSANNLPLGATFDPITATFSWIPEYDQAGNYDNVEFSVVDDGEPMGVNAELITISIGNVNRAPEFITIDPPSINENELLEFTVSATDPDNNIISLLSGELPSGATFDTNNGDFSWTPDYWMAGTYTVVFSATDDGDPNITSYLELFITVGDVPAPAAMTEEILEIITSEELDLPHEVVNSYVSNLKKVPIFVEKNKLTPAINQLNAFISKVENDIIEGKVDAEMGNDLIDKAIEIIQKITP